MITSEQKDILENLFNTFDSAIKNFQEGRKESSQKKILKVLKELKDNDLLEVKLAEIDAQILPKEFVINDNDITLGEAVAVVLTNICKGLASGVDGNNALFQGIKDLQEFLPDSSTNKIILIKALLERISQNTHAMNADRYDQDSKLFFEECDKASNLEYKLYSCAEALNSQVNALILIRDKLSESVFQAVGTTYKDAVVLIAQYIHTNINSNYATSQHNVDTYAMLSQAIKLSFPEGHDLLGLYQYYMSKGKISLGLLEEAKKEVDALKAAIQSGSLENKEALLADIDQWFTDGPTCSIRSPECIQSGNDQKEEMLVYSSEKCMNFVQSLNATRTDVLEIDANRAIEVCNQATSDNNALELLGLAEHA